MANINLSEIEELIENCSVPELYEEFDKIKEHLEYKSHLSTLDNRLRKLFDALRCLTEVSDTDLRTNIKFLASLLLLIEELRTDGAWNTDKSKQQANVLINIFKDAMGYCPSELLQNNEDSYNNKLFEECLSKLHKKLNPKQWKKYPSAIKVYCAVIDWLKVYSLYVPISFIFPASLLQMDDHMEINKLSGLDCSWKIFKSCQGQSRYKCGDYEVIVFDILIQLLRCREIQTLKKSLKSMTILLSLMAEEEEHMGKWTRCDDVIQVILEDVFFESNIESKIIYFRYLPKIIAIQKINFIRWKKKFYNVMYENLETCAIADYSQSLLEPCLVTFQVWLKYCWCSWDFTKDLKFIAIFTTLTHTYGPGSPCHHIIHIKRIKLIYTTLLSLCSSSEYEICLNAMTQLRRDTMFALIYFEQARSIRSLKNLLIFRGKVSYETWLEHCWCVREYKKDSKILSVLIKLLYINGLKSRRNHSACERIVNLIVSILAICTDQQRLNVIEEYNKNSAKVKCAHFHENWSIVKKKLYVETVAT